MAKLPNSQSLSQILPGLPSGARIVFLRLRSLGDAVLSTPALAALRAWRPDLRLAYVVEDRFAAALAGQVDLLLSLRTNRNEFGSASFETLDFWPLAKRLRAWRPQLAINLHGGGKATALMLASGAPLHAGFEGSANGWALNLRTPPAAPPLGRRRLHCVEHIASLLHALGLPAAALGPARVMPQPQALAAAHARLRQAGIEKPYLFIHAGAREPRLCWPPARMAAWLNQIHASYGWSVVMAREPGARQEIEEAVLAALDRRVPAACLRDTSVAELIALIAGAEWVAGNDGGPLHVGAALGKPVIAFFAATDPEIWHPWRVPYRLLRAEEGCADCPGSGCLRAGIAPCIRALELAPAIEAARSLADELHLGAIALPENPGL